MPASGGPACRSAASMLETPSLTGFSGEVLTRYGISLGSVSLADHARGQATSSARARASRASCWRRRCAAMRRPAAAHGPAGDGPQGTEARPRLLAAPRTAPRASCRSTAARWSGPDLGEIDLTFEHGRCRCAVLAAHRRRRHPRMLGSKAGLGERQAGRWPTKACSSAA